MAKEQKKSIQKWKINLENGSVAANLFVCVCQKCVNLEKHFCFEKCVDEKRILIEQTNSPIEVKKNLQKIVRLTGKKMP